MTEGRIAGYLSGQELDEAAPDQNSLALDNMGVWLRVIETGESPLVRSDYAEHTR